MEQNKKGISKYTRNFKRKKKSFEISRHKQLFNETLHQGNGVKRNKKTNRPIKGEDKMIKAIMIVDDENEDSDTIKTILEKEGYKTCCVKDGAKALDLLKRNSFDLILSDILMPTFSGYDLSRLIRKKYDDTIKMIFVSIVPKKEVDMSGVDGFVQKPFTPKNLIDEIKKVLKE